MQTAKTSFLILICVALLGACGLKGPLYLPEHDPAVKPDSGQDSDKDADAALIKKDTRKDEKKTTDSD